MKTIWKSNLNDAETIRASGSQLAVKLPAGAKVIAVQYQRGDLCVWSVVDTEAPVEDRPIHIVGTGKQIPDNTGYVGTVQDNSGLFVWHVFA